MFKESDDALINLLNFNAITSEKVSIALNCHNSHELLIRYILDISIDASAKSFETFPSIYRQLSQIPKQY